jgi:hypothetical protein
VRVKVTSRWSSRARDLTCVDQFELRAVLTGEKLREPGSRRFGSSETEEHAYIVAAVRSRTRALESGSVSLQSPIRRAIIIVTRPGLTTLQNPAVSWLDLLSDWTRRFGYWLDFEQLRCAPGTVALI